MTTRESRDLGRKATAWVATCFVLAGGAMSCVVMAFTLWDDPKWPLAGVGGATALMAAFMWSFRDRPVAKPGGRLWLRLVTRRDAGGHRVAYRLGRRETAPPVETSVNGPPSVERVRELSQGLHNWRPSGRNEAGR